MTIRLTQQTWDAIRTDYLNGATAVELARRYGGVKAKSIHARAYKERWRELPLPSGSDQALQAQVAWRAKVQGIPLELAAKLVEEEKDAVMLRQRHQVETLNDLIDTALGHISEVADGGDKSEVDAMCAVFSPIKDIAVALSLKIRMERITLGLPSDS